MKKSAKITIIVFSTLIAIIGLAICFFFLLIEPNVNILNSPDLDLDSLTSFSRTVSILDKDGDPIDDALYDSNKIYVKIDDLPAYVTQAFISIEDKRFYDHGGIDYKRVVSAALTNIKTGSFSEGASTITQQLIKNTHLTNEKTLRRKINEMRLARKLERLYDKNQILESYLNILYFGSGIHGLGTASRVMFECQASDLTIAQSAALASIINNPSKYNPYSNRENLEKRKNLVLNQMYEQGYITEDEMRSAISEHLIFNKSKHKQFTDGLLRSACELYNCSEKELFLNNRKFKTAYDKTVVECARNCIRDMQDFNGLMRILVLNNADGGIVCDETNTDRYIDMRRSPASAIKPFIAYAPALENGKTPLSQILDEPTVFGDYAPKNYHEVYRGYISLTDGLKYSSNIAAVKLLDEVGVLQAKNTAQKFGLSFENNDNSLSLALGGMEKGITLSELANAYRTLANGGVYSKISYFESDAFKRSYRAVEDDTAYLLTDMLKECAKTGTAKKLQYCGNIAAKTGTNGDSNGNYDCYCIAYTPKQTIAVWMGSPDLSAPLDNSITGSTACSIIKKMYNNKVIDTNADFEMPDSVAYYEIDDLELRNSHELYLADPLLAKRYRRRALLSKRFLPIRKHIDIIDFFDSIYWQYDNSPT